MANSSFTSAGAVPNLGTSPNAKYLNSSTISTNPAAAALARAQGAAGLKAPTPTPPAIPAPTTPVKSTTVNNADGSSHTTTYHAPEKTGVMGSANSDAGTLVATPKYGDTVTDTQGRTGTAMFDPNTGKPLQNPAGTPAPTTAQTAPTSTFSGLLGAAGSAAKEGSKTAPGYIKKTADYGAGNIDIGQKAADIAAEYGKKIADVGGQGAKFEAGQLTTGTSPVAQGNAAVTAQTTAAQQQALAEGESAALQGTGQELTGQNQAANAANAAAGQAIAGQGLEQTGLTSAAQLAQPNATSQGQTVFDPTTGKFTGGSYQDNLSTVVNAIKNGQIGYSAGVDSLSGLSPTAKADVLAALGPGFDTVAADAAAAAKGSNIQTGGTATTGANAQGLAQSIQQETELNTAATNAQALANQVSDTLTKVGLTNSTDANTAINNLQSRLGNSAYTQLNIAVNDARNAYQAILTATGATPTDAGAAANQNINANMSPNQIKAAIDQLNQGIKARQDAAHQQTTQYQNQLQGSGNTSNSSGGTTVQTKYGAINTSW